MNDAAVAQREADRLGRLAERLKGHADFQQVTVALEEGGRASLEGVWGAVRALTAAALAETAPGPVVIVLPQVGELDDFCDELALFAGKPCRSFPAWETSPSAQTPGDDLYAQRLKLIKALAAEDVPPIIVTGIQALMQPVPDLDRLASQRRVLRVGGREDLNGLLAWLVDNGLQRTTAVELPGEFSSRGGILDIFAPDADTPIRVEFFGDEVESIRLFDAATQRSIGELVEVDISIVKPDADDVECLLNLLPAESWLLLIEPEEMAAEATRFQERWDQPQKLLSRSVVMQAARQFACATAEAVATAPLPMHGRLPLGSVERFSGDVARVRGELDAMAGENDVLIVCQTEAEIKRLTELLGGAKLAKRNKLLFSVGHLRSGFRYDAEQLLVVSGSELFLRQDLPRPARRRLGKSIDSFTELREGDLVVHLTHGLGRYRGLSLLEKDGAAVEHLAIEFAGDTKIYVPATRIALIQKYVGGKKARPRLATIGGRTWVRQKQAAEKAVTDLASDMLELHAARAARPGIAFPPDTEWQREFDAAFPYDETPDQLAALTAIKEDMERPRPMDRLLCGDVGYGKTEVAIRGAFKAVDSGYQVAVLVPTTILAEQHLNTFQSRMAEFPFQIAALSRFSTKGEQDKVVKRLAEGAVDIVIGTHRLASPDVAFHNLGLVIIDEEQRFGVEVKDRLKRLRQTVDVLTMTATPIPRTLHLSLVGARDISNLETPPEERMAVETKVSRFDEDLIRHALLQELARQGQAYFVHNRIEDIQLLAARLKKIVPEARIAIGHGQMPEHQLEQVMLDFIAHRTDVLLATTIVESGLDIPNANTIFIDEADRYGLADLHQLRGRVGRYKHRAFCYLLLDPRRNIAPNAARRLRAIEEFSQMGAGFAIAMRDLEIRGAGNILGTEQSGHIAAVGYEMYCELLEDAVRRLKREPLRGRVDVDIVLPVEAHLPRSYVGDMRAKLDLYRRLGRVTAQSDVDELVAEMIDRFGPLPAPALTMVELTRLRCDAALWGLDAIQIEESYLVLRYRDRARIEQLARQSGGRLRVVDEASAYLPLGAAVRQPEAVLSAAKTLLRPL